MGNLTHKELKTMIEVAKFTRDNAFAAKTEHKIGACVLTLNGQYFGGCNIESNISGLGICAERCAVNNAILNGEYSFKALLIYDKELQIPCGACLQYLSEFIMVSQYDPEIVCASESDEIKQHKLFSLLSRPYFSKKTDKYAKYKHD